MAWAAPLAIWDFDGTSPFAGTNLDTTGSVATVHDADDIGTADLNRNLSPTINNVDPGGGSGGIEPYESGQASGGVGVANRFGGTGVPDPENYIQFRLTLGNTVDSSVSQLQGITFDLARGGDSNRGFEITYRVGSTGGFSSLGSTLPPTGTNNYGRFTFNLDTPASLSANNDIEFRFLGFNSNDTHTLLIDNVTVTAIPEPGSLLLMVLGFSGLMLLKRRCKS